MRYSCSLSAAQSEMNILIEHIYNPDDDAFYFLFCFTLRVSYVLLIAQLCATNDNNNQQSIKTNRRPFSLSLSLSFISWHWMLIAITFTFTRNSRENMECMAVVRVNLLLWLWGYLLFVSHVTLISWDNFMYTSTFLRLLSQLLGTEKKRR